MTSDRTLVQWHRLPFLFDLGPDPGDGARPTAGDTEPWQSSAGHHQPLARVGLAPNANAVGIDLQLYDRDT